MSIDEFIEIVYPKLKHKVSVGQEIYTGEELMLTGVKPPEGGWKKTAVYPINVPVVEVIDHKRNLRMEWLKKGKSGVRKYLEPYIDKISLEKVMTVL